MINMIVLYKGLLLKEFYVNIHKMTWSDVAIFWQSKIYHIVPERFQFGYCRSNDPEKAWSYN